MKMWLNLDIFCHGKGRSLGPKEQNCKDGALVLMAQQNEHLEAVWGLWSLGELDTGQSR